MANSEQSLPSELTPEQQAHRNAGEKYFEEVLKKVQAGEDPFQPRQLSDAPPLSTSPPPTKTDKRKKPRPKSDAVDPDMQAVGTIIEGSQLYIVLVVFILCTPVSLVLTRSTLIFLKTPSVLFFLYAISIMLLATLSSQWTQLSPPGRNRQLFSIKNIILVGIQAIKQLGFFGILVNNSLYLGIALILTIDQLTTVLIKFLKTKSMQEFFQAQSAPILISILGLTLALIGSGLADIYSYIMFILFWGACAAEKWIDLNIEQFEQSLQKFLPSQPPLIPSYQIKQQQIKEIDKLFSQYMIACVPILVLGFIMLEGVEVVEHEPSVPTLSIMLLGCATFALARISGAVLGSVQGGKTMIIAKICALCLTIVFNLIERGLAPTGLVMLTLVGAIVVVAGYSIGVWSGDETLGQTF